MNEELANAVDFVLRLLSRQAEPLALGTIVKSSSYMKTLYSAPVEAIGVITGVNTPKIFDEHWHYSVSWVSIDGVVAQEGEEIKETWMGANYLEVLKSAEPEDQK